MSNRRLTRRDFLKGAGVTGLGLALTACVPPTPAPVAPVEKEVAAPAPVEKVKIVYWHGWTEKFEDMVIRLAKGFMSRNPDIEVEEVVVPHGEMFTKILTAVAAGDVPDVMMVFNGGGRVYSLAEEKAILPLADVGDPDSFAAVKEWIFPASWDLATYKGELYGLPQWQQAYCIQYNKKLLAEAGIPDAPPKDLAELDAIAEKLTVYDDKGNIRRMGFYDTWLNRWLPHFGGRLLDEQGNPQANHPNNVKALEWIVSYSHKYDIKKISDFTAAIAGERAGAVDPFLMEQYAMWANGPWVLGTTKEYAPEGFQYGVWNLPPPPGMTGYGTWTYGDILTIPKGTKHPAEAFRYIRYLTGLDDPETYSSLYLMPPIGGGRPHMPPSQKLVDTPAFKKVIDEYPGYEKFLDALFKADRYLFPPKIPIAEFYSSRIGPWVDRARLLEVTPQEALDGLQDEVMKEWEKYQQQ